MKLHQESNADQNVVTGYDLTQGAAYVEVNKTRYSSSILLFAEGPIVPWQVHRFEDLAPTDFIGLLDHTPELVILGTGAKLRFGHPRLYASLSAQRIGVDTMDLTAACRTFNILVSEGRRVAAALLIESP